MKVFASSVAILLLLPLIVAAEPSAVVSVKLTPAGSFKSVTKDVKGTASRQGKVVTAQNIIVNLANLNSGIGLRDEHTANKYLEVSKFPSAILVSAKGENGKGTGVIKIKGIEKPISGTYLIKGNELEAVFDLNLSDFAITGIKYMGVGVNNTVKISVTVPVTTEAAAKASPVVKKK